VSRRSPALGAPAPPKPKEPKRTWRHPSQRSIEVPYPTAVTVALMQMGIRDYAVIAGAVALTVQDVRRIDLVEDESVRQLGLLGIPHGVYFRLHEKVRCPKCSALLTMAPCIACDSATDAPPSR
jgi:hypothetical protein